MLDLKNILELYLRKKLDIDSLHITQLEKLPDGWESDNYRLIVDLGNPMKQADWVLRIYSGEGSKAKAAWEFKSMMGLLKAGYPVPKVNLLETGTTPLGNPFVIMDFIPGEVMWDLLKRSSPELTGQLIDQFTHLFVQLHQLDWHPFDNNIPPDDPFFFIDHWMERAKRFMSDYPEFEGSTIINWVTKHRDRFSCPHPSPLHLDFHPGNILVTKDGDAKVIDWTNFEVSDARFDLAWTLVLAHAHSTPGLRDQIYDSYIRTSVERVDEIEVFEVIACVRRLVDLSISLTQGAQTRGMNPLATEAMRASMAAHRKVHDLFINHTGIHNKVFEKLFN